MPDVRDAEEEEVAHFSEFIDKAYRLWLSKPCRRMHSDIYSEACLTGVYYSDLPGMKLSIVLKCNYLILRKIIKFVATRRQILRLKCTRFNFGWGSAPDPAGGAYSAPPDPLAGFKGPTSKAVSYTHLTLPTKRIV